VEADDTEFVALINSDVELEPNWLSELVRTLEAYPDACSASGKMLHFHERHLLDGTGDQLHWSTLAVRRGQGEADEGQSDTEGPVLAASAAAGLFRREAFEQVGLMDPDFFCWFEDVDLLASSARRLGVPLQPARRGLPDRCRHPGWRAPSALARFTIAAMRCGCC
jgi:GT2 family glycosyltransferase